MSSKILLCLSLVVVAEIWNVNGISYFVRPDSHEDDLSQFSNDKSDIGSCHDYYSKVMRGLLDTYNTNIQICEENETRHLADVETGVIEYRNSTTQTLNEVCASLDVCKKNGANLDFFDCVNSSGNNSTRDLWKASQNSSQIAANIREQIRAIKFQTTKCTNEADRLYFVASNQATAELKACYANGGMPTKN